MGHTRRGFSLVELLVVMVLVGGLTAMSLPRIRDLRDGYRVQTAKQKLSATIATARAAAVQKGRPARFLVRNSVISALVDTNATLSMHVVPEIDLAAEYGVTVTLAADRRADSLITFEARGFASPRVASPRALYVLRGISKSDTVCVGVLGQLVTRGCT